MNDVNSEFSAVMRGDELEPPELIESSRGRNSDNKKAAGVGEPQAALTLTSLNDNDCTSIRKHGAMQLAGNPEQAFRSAIEAAGLTPPETIIGDGKIHRFSTNGKPNDNAGWYILHMDNMPAGRFGSWREDINETWCSIKYSEQTKEQKKEYATLLKSMQDTRNQAKKAKHDAAAEIAAATWPESSPIDAPAADSYLANKGTQAHGARFIETKAARKHCVNLPSSLSGPLLVIPICNAAGQLRSLQFISSDGTKIFITGGEKKGCYYLINKPDSVAQRGPLILCEGFATGASIHEATGLSVAVAFDAGNLEPVARALRKQPPNKTLIFAADDDHQTHGNPGIAAAEKAKKAVGGFVVVPKFPANRPDKATDFNDLHQLEGCGLDAVKACFSSVIESIAGCASDTDNEDEEHNEHEEPTTSLFPDMDHRPSYTVLDDCREDSKGKHRPGVYFCGVTSPKKDEPPKAFNTWICSPIHIDAVTFDGQNNNFGRLLRFKPTVGDWRRWAMPMELLAGDGSQLRGELLAMGVELDPYKARQQLPAYIQSEQPKRRIHCALQVGWCGDVFVLPDTVIGPKSEDMIFQSGERGHEEHTQAGMLAGWKDGIAAKAVGNPLLMLALSASFAGPLLKRCNSEGGGIHFFGDSSTGKSTMVEAACATWGGPSFKRSWKATANGMEGTAAMFNDCLLALDEISECDPKEIGTIVYSLGNGIGKQRASRSGNARSVTRWRCLVISSGEYTIATSMQEGGHRAKAGQAVRLLDIPAAQTYGAWDNLHGASSAPAFSDAIKQAAAQYHGKAGRAFLEKLTFDKSDFCAMLEEVKASTMFTTDSTEGQDKRAAARFALIGLAGELATDYGITGWPMGAASEAAAISFKLWLSMRGKGNDERRQILQKVSDFIERHGDGRFSNKNGDNDTPVRDRAGWWSDSDTTGKREYLFTSEGMREALRGFDFKRALNVLQKANALPAQGAKGERSKPYKINGRVVKLYAIDPNNLEGGDHGA